VHIVDLSAAKGEASAMATVIRQVVETSELRVQVGGGVRDREGFARLLDAGATRVVVGSLAVREPELVQELLAEYGPESLTLAADVGLVAGEPMIRVDAWREDSGCTLWDLLEKFDQVVHVLCTDVSRDGLLSGPSLDLYELVRLRFPGLALQASGGVSDMDDLVALRVLGVAGTIVGRAIYEGRVSVLQVFRC
jgi:phosphoribosylformimino-5-aminoimidazole carboxamide ribotide isomerase